MVRKKLFFVFTTFFISSLVLLPAAEADQPIRFNYSEIIESCEFPPTPVAVGENFKLTVILNYASTKEVSLSLENRPSWATLWQGPYIRTFTDYLSQKKVKITVTFRLNESGRKIFPSLPLTIGNQIYNLPPFLVRGGVYKNRKLIIPLEVEWNTELENLYLGEAFPVYLNVVNQEAVKFFDETNVALPSSGFFENAGDFGMISSTNTKEIILYTIPAAAYIFTPIKTGINIIPAASVKSNGLTGWSDNLRINVKNIPEEIKESGAIGNFKVDSSISREELFVGDDLTYNYTISGNGNLNYLKLPEPEVTGLLLVSSIIRDDYNYSVYGYSGSKTLSLTYKAKTPGLVKITVPDFYYLDKGSESVVCIKKPAYTIDIANTPIVDDSGSNDNNPFKKLKQSDFSWKNHYKKAKTYLWLLPGLLSYLLFRIFRHFKVIYILLLSILTTIIILSLSFALLQAEPQKIDITDSQTFYKKAETQYSKGLIPQSIHNLRAAIFINPVNSSYREVLKQIESENNFINSVEASKSLHPDIFYYILVLTFNLLFFSLIFKNSLRNSFFSILFLFLVLLSTISIGIIIYSDISRAEKTGIIAKEDAFIKKIPQNSATKWMTIKEGTAVRILEEFDDFYLIETGSGLLGWLKSEYLLPDLKF